MPEPSKPTEKELQELPRWAVVAFAARCARRVQPLFERWDTGKTHTTDIENAILLAERATHADREATETTTAAVAAAINTAKAANTTGETATAAAAIAAADAATHAANAARVNAGAFSNAFSAAFAAANASTHAARAAGVAASHAADVAESDTGTAVAEIVMAMRRDFELLEETTKQEGWTDDTPVPPEFFGPLWAEGDPKGWPAKEKTSEGQELVFEFEIPEGMSDAEAMERISTLIDKADDLHRAHGGRGLRTKGVEVYGREPVGDPVGVT